jgi:ABC-type branched-subunit amino acid transport system substrate-binding protein
MRVPVKGRGAKLARMFALCVALGATVVASTATGGSAARAKACSGTPLKVMAEGNLSSAVSLTVPQVVAGVKAAAANVTATCQLGRPVQVIGCDDKFDPNAAAACARQAVSSKVIAVVSFSGFDDNINPILQKAGIPSVGNNGASSTDSSSPISFPGQASLTELLGELDILASLGAKNIAVAALNIPAISFLTNLLKQKATAFGSKVTVISVEPTASDLSSTAGQVLSTGADGLINILATAQTTSMLKSLASQGANFHKLRVIGDLSSFTPKEVQDLGPKYAGVLNGGGTWSPTDLGNPAIKRYFSELKAAKLSTSVLETSNTGVTAWAAVHLVADALAGQKKQTTAVLIKRLKTPGVLTTTKYGLPPIDYSKAAFPSDPVLSKLRLFTKYDSAWQIDSKGQLKPLSSKWLDVTKRMPIKSLTG